MLFQIIGMKHCGDISAEYTHLLSHVKMSSLSEYRLVWSDTTGQEIQSYTLPDQEVPAHCYVVVRSGHKRPIQRTTESKEMNVVDLFLDRNQAICQGSVTVTLHKKKMNGVGETEIDMRVIS